MLDLEKIKRYIANWNSDYKFSVIIVDVEKLQSLVAECERLQTLEKSLNTLKCNVCGEYAYESED